VARVARYNSIAFSRDILTNSALLFMVILRLLYSFLVDGS
jgi:hypothetical protein